MAELAAQSADTASQERIRRAAQGCLRRLKLRAKQQPEKEGLILPANAPENSQAVLLRSAERKTDDEPDTLLRPS